VSLPADAYGAFARVYDKALGELFFHGVALVLRALEAEYPTERRTHLDIACGTGLAMRHFVLEIATRYDEAANLAAGRVRGWHDVRGERHIIDETHYQRAWERDDVIALLLENGLETVDIFGFNPFAARVFEGGDVKEMYVARRKRSH